MAASTKIWTTIKAFGKWAQKNPILTAGFGGTGLFIANERTGRWDVKDAFHPRQ
ncbi:hypothetical protein B9Z19DRAFT_1070331 [Tuber borchii]|uniref:Uncharacterized protein n=1 Tax=Tuber borchii TaxID=42251 RepID=A0A2T7A9L2_TUBBO|nr:hypothetical protein B9Z19DRAFT_1070331 [Tuber borchii]